MSSREAILLAQYDRDLANRLQNRQSAPFWDGLRDPSVLVPLLVLVLTYLYSVHARPWRPADFLSLYPRSRQQLWDVLVRAAPAKLVFAIDDWLNPFPLPRPMLFPRQVTYQAKSDALERILGRGRHGGIVESVSHAGKVGFSHLAGKGSSETPAGLMNVSNSCYQNSILQALASLRPLREYLDWIVSEEGEYGLGRMYATEALSKLVRDLHGEAENGQTLWTPPILKSMNTYQQQDAQEYFTKLLNEVQEEIEKALKAAQRRPGLELDGAGDETAASQHSDDSGYHSASTQSKHPPLERSPCFRMPLEGLAAQRVVCQSCGYSSGISLSPFCCLTLNLGEGRAEYRLEETLDACMDVENLEGIHCANCTLIKFRDRIQIIIERVKETAGVDDDDALRLTHRVPFERLEAIERALEEEDHEEKTLAETCKIPANQRVKSTKTKQTGIARPPASIAFHINRSRFDEATGFTFKNPAAVRFPARLDLGPWCLGSAGSSLPSGPEGEKGQPGTDEERWELPPQVPMVSGSRHRSKLAGPFYELRAVITHYGQHENGHYVCYRKHPPRQRGRRERGRHGGKVEADADHRPANLVSETGVHEHQDDIDLDERLEDEGEGLEERRGGDGEGGEGEEQPSWWRLSDQHVTRSDEEIVLAQGGVFMLFYDRVDPNSVLVSPQGDGEDEETEPVGAGSDAATEPEAESVTLRGSSLSTLVDRRGAESLSERGSDAGHGDPAVADCESGDGASNAVETTVLLPREAVDSAEPGQQELEHDTDAPRSEPVEPFPTLVAYDVAENVGDAAPLHAPDTIPPTPAVSDPAEALTAAAGSDVLPVMPVATTATGTDADQDSLLEQARAVPLPADDDDVDEW